jgi:superfamily II DNA or RNA helicase
MDYQPAGKVLSASPPCGFLFIPREAFMEVDFSDLIGTSVNMTGHFAKLVTVEAVKVVGDSAMVRVRTIDGRLEEAMLTSGEVTELLSQAIKRNDDRSPYPGEDLRLTVEACRIRLAYAYDPYFAVSLSGIRSLPHQLEAVYGKMLPLPRMRFLLADDPGAGKTIMAGLLIKELKMRGTLERVLIIVPAALTIQWQDELLRFFNELFVPITAENDKQQLINLWQRESQVITSLDYAKRPEVRERVWSADWDLIIVDEAHKCAAHTKTSSKRSPESEKTKRYQLIEQFSDRASLSLLFLTATPHQGDADRFSHFLHLLDPDVFPEPHRMADKVEQLNKGVLELGKDCPWIIRRLKEDLRDFNGRRLFPNRRSQTAPFALSVDEFSLYQNVNDYLNRFLAGGSGRAKQSIALTRTVLQRRVASSTFAIYESLKRRLKKQKDLLEEVRALPQDRQRQRLNELTGGLVDDERDEGDLDEVERDQFVDDFVAAERIEQLEEEIVALRDLVEYSKSVYESASDSKLSALRSILTKAEFGELRDGRGKLLVFTEHRDTMNHLEGHIKRWGFSTCHIHGGMNPHERKRAQEVFRTEAQVCIATEAAGEGINLQFCHLMINYDLPWNPARLEQRMGRIHRIGQDRDVYVFNFVAESSIDGKPVIEGRILRRLLDKLEQIRMAIGSDRVYDVIGQILTLNDVNLADMLREAALNPGRLADYENQITNLSPDRLRLYEDETGIALAREYVDLPSVLQKKFVAEEKRLMPEYIAEQFFKAAQTIGLKVERRADGLLRVPYVPQDLRSESLGAVKRFGKAEDHYNKITFYKEHLDQDRHLDAALISPGHPLYGAVEEKLHLRLTAALGRCGVFVDLDAAGDYFLHFFEMQIVGDYPRPNTLLYAELVAVQQHGENLTMVPPDLIHDFAPVENLDVAIPRFSREGAELYLRGSLQLQRRMERLDERLKQKDIIEEHTKRTFDERLWAAQRRAMDLRARYEGGEHEVELALRESEREVENIERRRVDRLAALSNIGVVRSGPVRYIASFYVLPPGEFPKTQQFVEDLEAKRKSEMSAMQRSIEYERGRGWETEDVSLYKIGFDIRSQSQPEEQTGRRDVRRIEVKGRRGGESIRLTENEWRKAKQLKDTYWLYVVWNPSESDSELLLIQNPAEILGAYVHEVMSISQYELSADVINKFAHKP